MKHAVRLGDEASISTHAASVSGEIGSKVQLVQRINVKLISSGVEPLAHTQKCLDHKHCYSYSKIG